MNKRIEGLLFFFLIVLFAGFSFLIFEVSWFRMLSLVVGATISAATIVLVAFMLGFGFGAFYWGKKVISAYHPVRLLYFLFVAIGALGLVNYFLINNLIPGLYSFFNHASFSIFLSEFLSFIFSILLLFIPAFFMGGVVPVVSKIIVRSNSVLSGFVGKIYTFETIGSTLGGFMAGFVLIGHFGQKNTIYLAVFINLCLAVFLFFYKRLSSITKDETTTLTPEAKLSSKQKKVTEKINITPINKKTALFATFICGFVVVGMQVVWMRIFRIYMTNTSYTFSLIASMVILGLFVGSWLYMRNGEKIKEQSYSMVKLLLYMGLFVLFGFIIVLKLPSLLFFPLGNMQEIHIVRIIIIPLIASLFIIIPVTIISGYVFPFACTMFTTDYKELSRNIGQILLVNTAGSILGPILSAYVLIPFLGAGLTIIFFLFVLLLFVLIMIIKLQEIKKLSNLKLLIIIISSIILLVLVFRPKVYILPPSFSKYQKKILAYKETVEGTYVVGQESDGQSVVLSTYVNNSTVIGSTYDAIKAVKMVGHIPFFAGLKCNDALVVGFGIGVTASAIASHAEVKSIDCVELVAGLKDAAHYYSDLNNNIERDIRLKIYSGDGRHYLQSHSKKYDLISSDPTHPILGSGNIYTREYFELCKSHLNEGGMVSEYLPLHKLLLKDFLGIIKTFHTVFPNATVWLGHYHAILIGSNGNMKIDFAKWTENISKSVKDIYFYNEPYHVAACLVLDSAQIEKITKDIQINTDDRSYAEFFAFSSFNKDNLTKNLKYLSQNRGGLDNVFCNIPDTSRMSRFLKGNILLTDGLYSFLQGDMNGFKSKLETACKENPEDEEFPFLIKFHFR